MHFRFDNNESVSASCRKAAVGILVLHFSMLTWISACNAPVCDEVGHLTAGLYAWHHGTFFLYRVNPPLVKLLAALPAAMANPQTDWSHVADGPGVRTEFKVGRDFLHANAPVGYGYHTAGRLLCVPLTVLGGWMCWLWANSLYGPRAGIAACLLWCFNPVVFGWGATFTPDAASASLGLVAVWTFRKWLSVGTWANAAIAGTTLGLCELTKTTWIVLYPLWPVLWLIWRSTHNDQRPSISALPQLILLIGVSVYVLNLGYGFEGTGRQLGEYDFVSMPLTGHETTGRAGNRFRDTMLARVPIPLPRNYVRGIDLQKVDFEKGMPSYLWGKWSDRGWWYYYPLAAILKLPLGLVALCFASIAVHVFFRRQFPLSADELLLVIPAATVFVLICSQTGFTRYVRYLLPCLPAALILVSKFWREGSAFPNWGIRTACVLLLWAILSPICYFPHGISYFNELAGGPGGGYQYLLDANVDWGQDLFRVKAWSESHVEAHPFYYIHRDFVAPANVGMQCETADRMSSDSTAESFEPRPGWYAVSIHELYEQHGFYRYLQSRNPVDRVGYSTLIYHVPKSD